MRWQAHGPGPGEHPAPESAALSEDHTPKWAKGLPPLGRPCLCVFFVSLRLSPPGFT